MSRAKTRRRSVGRARKSNATEGKLWQARESVARPAIAFWNDFLVLRMGPTSSQPLDAAAIERWVTIVRAVSWVESKHGTATTNQGTRDPMQCGHPQDAWWRELVRPGGPGQDRFITGPGGTNYYAGDLPAAVESTAAFPTDARISALADRTRGHDDPRFGERTSYYWGVPFLVHRTNTMAGGMTYKCVDLSRDRLIAGAVAYNGGGDPSYGAKIEEALALSGGLPPGPKVLRAAASRAAAVPALTAVGLALDDLLAWVSTRPGVPPIREALITVLVETSGGDARIVPPDAKQGNECVVTLRLHGRRRKRGSPSAESSPHGAVAEALEIVLRASVLGPGSDVEVDVDLPLAIEWIDDALLIRPSATASHVLHVKAGSRRPTGR